MGLLKVPFGHDSSHRLILIKDAQRTENYTCPGCGGLLTVRQGAKVRWHFAHRVGNEETCTKETYLHRVGKLLLFKRIQSAIQSGTTIHIKLKRRQIVRIGKHVDCEALSQDHDSSLDLLEGVHRVSLEKTVQGFRPDLLLEGLQHVFGIEVFVTSSVSEEKKSAIPFAEFKLTELEDLEWLQNGEWYEGDSLSLYGVDALRQSESIELSESLGRAVELLYYRLSSSKRLTYTYFDRIRSVHYNGTYYRANIVDKKTVDMAEQYGDFQVSWDDGILSLNMTSKNTGKQLKMVLFGEFSIKPRGIDIVYIEPSKVLDAINVEPLALEKIRKTETVAERKKSLIISDGDVVVRCYGKRRQGFPPIRFELTMEELERDVRSGAIKLIAIERISTLKGI